MDKFIPYFTGDSSVGLYSDEFDDIYHSACGALSEAYDKFIIPSDINSNKHNNINILDICYGLGYNTKAFINCYLNNNYKKLENKKINITCVDINSTFIKLSPFIKTNQNYYDILFHHLYSFINKNNLKKNQYNKIQKYFNHINIQPNQYKISDAVNELLILKLFEKYDSDFFNNDLAKILYSKNFKPFLRQNYINFAKFYQNWRINYLNGSSNRFNLHNIYYQYLSKRYKLDYLDKLNDIFNINFIDSDARNAVKDINNKYDYVFLDAFTTNKCPALWTLDFIKEVFNVINDDGLLLTYSTSALVRNTMLQSGFHIGKILNNQKKVIGTICSKNKNKIKHNLSDYELGLLNTKAGIPYRDVSLKSVNSDIIKKREEDVCDSELLSSSKYVKQFKGNLK